MLNLASYYLTDIQVVGKIERIFFNKALVEPSLLAEILFNRNPECYVEFDWRFSSWSWVIEQIFFNLTSLSVKFCELLPGCASWFQVEFSQFSSVRPYCSFEFDENSQVKLIGFLSARNLEVFYIERATCVHAKINGEYKFEVRLVEVISIRTSLSCKV